MKPQIGGAQSSWQMPSAMKYIGFKLTGPKFQRHGQENRPPPSAPSICHLGENVAEWRGEKGINMVSEPALCQGPRRMCRLGLLQKPTWRTHCNPDRGRDGHWASVIKWLIYWSGWNVISWGQVGSHLWRSPCLSLWDGPIPLGAESLKAQRSSISTTTFWWPWALHQSLHSRKNWAGNGSTRHLGSRCLTVMGRNQMEPEKWVQDGCQDEKPRENIWRQNWGERAREKERQTSVLEFVNQLWSECISEPGAKPGDYLCFSAHRCGPDRSF